MKLTKTLTRILVLAAGLGAVARGAGAQTPLQFTDGIFSAQNQAAAATSQLITGALLGEAALPPGGPGTGGWLRVAGALMNVSGQAQAENYRADSGGLLGGFDTAVGPTGLRLGLSAGYYETWVRDSAFDGGIAKTVSLGLYGSQPIGPVLLVAAASYAHADDNTTRQTGRGGATESHGSDIFSGGVQLSLPLTIFAYDVTPAAGMRLTGVNAGRFTETAPAGVLTVSGASATYDSGRPFADIAITRSFITPSRLVIAPAFLAGYEIEAGDLSQVVGLTAAGSAEFNSSAPKLHAGDTILSGGVNAGYGNWSLFAKYTAQVSGNWTAQIGQAGLNFRF